ncbi:oxidoreductase [Pseudoalteromonas rubra]|uniref:Oxidoreductase n=2 Tax=Pseudoalteromonas rubra TaxID=43658 RepID=A0A0U2XBA8_9GAMM|nr:oxidoreductase [Pseudoalteromonas rubra]
MQCMLPAWRDGYYRARIESVRVFTKQSVELLLVPEKGWPTHKSGQHLALTLNINGRLVTRVFTIASSAEQLEAQNTLRLLIRTQDKGALTAHLSKLTRGEWVNISKPQGTFLLPRTEQPVVMLAGGSGITPFIAMLHSIPKGDTRPITLLYYAKKNAHWLNTELAQLQVSLPGFEYRLLERDKDGDAVKALSPYTGKKWLVCGPEGLHKQVAQLAEQTNTPLASEHFSATPRVDLSTERAEFTVTYNGKQFMIDNQHTLLAHLKAKQQEVNAGCGMGICHQCKCVKKRGVVRDTRTGELSDNTEQLIQLCVSQVVSDVELVK